MLDIKVIRENPEKVKAALNRRCKDYSAEVDRVLELDTRRRDIIGQVEAIKAAQNAENKKIPQLKKAGEDTTAIFAELKKLGREDIVVVVGGVIPAQDYDQLYKDGAAAIFGPGTPVATAAIKIMEILG